MLSVDGGRGLKGRGAGTAQALQAAAQPLVELIRCFLTRPLTPPPSTPPCPTGSGTRAAQGVQGSSGAGSGAVPPGPSLAALVEVRQRMLRAVCRAAQTLAAVVAVDEGVAHHLLQEVSARACLAAVEREVAAGCRQATGLGSRAREGGEEEVAALLRVSRRAWLAVLALGEEEQVRGEQGQGGQGGGGAGSEPLASLPSSLTSPHPLTTDPGGLLTPPDPTGLLTSLPAAVAVRAVVLLGLHDIACRARLVFEAEEEEEEEEEVEEQRGVPVMREQQGVRQRGLQREEQDWQQQERRVVPVQRKQEQQGQGKEKGIGRGLDPDPPTSPSHPRRPLIVLGEAWEEAAGQVLWQRLLDLALGEGDLASDKVKWGSELHRQKVRLWQALVVMTGFVPRDQLEGAAQAVLGQITKNETPAVKQYQEAVAAALLLRKPALVQTVLLPQLSAYERHHAGVGSFILVAALVVLHSPPAWQSRLLPALLLSCSPWLTCHTHNIRSLAQLITHTLLQRFPPQHPVWGHSHGDVRYLRQLSLFFDTNTDILRLRRTLGATLPQWRPDGLTAPWRVLGPGPGLVGQAPETAGYEAAPPTLMERVTAFLQAERYRLRDEMGARQADTEYQEQGGWAGPQEGGGAPRPPGPLPRSLPQVCGSSAGSQAMRVRVSMVVVVMMVELLSAGPEGAQQGGQQQEGGQQQQWGQQQQGGLWASLLASGVAALLELAPEQQLQRPAGGRAKAGARALGGEAEEEDEVLEGGAGRSVVFRACQMVVPDIRVTLDPGFAAISVTAEQWVPLVEVKEAALLAWLERKQSEGWQLVGLEQTSESTRLPDYAFPPRCVLVLGREKEGLPAEVLQLLDSTVEIPQLKGEAEPVDAKVAKKQKKVKAAPDCEERPQLVLHSRPRCLALQQASQPPSIEPAVDAAPAANGKASKKDRSAPTAPGSDVAAVQSAEAEPVNGAAGKEKKSTNAAAPPAATPALAESDAAEGDAKLQRRAAKKRKQQESSEVEAGVASTQPAGDPLGGTAARAFQRVKAEEWLGKKGSVDNSYEGTFGEAGWGYKAQQVLGAVRGKDFRHEKTKKKRGSYRGGNIDPAASHSFKFDSDGDD
ncbi:hypothetical protein V8C86DRAFT_3022592 [Haematococcus lacustris]